jgi:VIT1/CCC1 family predicted Fe2+/Mn2+ transporter
VDREVHYTSEADKFRTIVFGIQDGLITVASIVMGAAGFSSGDLKVVLISALIALFGSAISMAVGEFISTRVRMQIYDNEVNKERREIRNNPERELQELKTFYVNKGFSEEEARRIAEALFRNEEVVLNEMLTHELKIFPEEFESPAKLGLIMFVYMLVGGFIPTAPIVFGYLLNYNSVQVLSYVSIALTLATLALFGVLSTKYTGLKPWRGAFEQVGTGAVALGISYAVGVTLSYIIGPVGVV